MANCSKEILALARRGAEVRWRELQAEATALLVQFPGLGHGTKVGKVRLGVGSGRSKRARTMSAAQRRAVSARMKKYWAERRKAKA